MKKLALAIIILAILPTLSYAERYVVRDYHTDRSNPDTGYDNGLSDGDFNYFYPKEVYDLRYPHTLPEYIPMPFENKVTKSYPRRAEFPEDEPGQRDHDDTPAGHYDSYSVGDESYLRYYHLGSYAVKDEDEPEYRPKYYSNPDSYYDDRIHAYVVSPATYKRETHTFQVIYS